MRTVRVDSFPVRVVPTTMKSIFFNENGQCIAFDNDVRRGVDFIVGMEVGDAVANFHAVTDVTDEVFFNGVQVAFNDFADDDVFAGW